MTKHRKPTCTSSVRKKGNFVEVKAKCHIGKAGSTTTSSCKRSPKASKKRGKHTEVPVQCKGLKKKSRKACAKKICAQRPREYQSECLRKAGIR